MTMRPLRIGIVAGEESGDLLGADLVRALGTMSGRPIELVGVGGRHLEELGLRSLFDAGDIALIGISAVLRDLPRLIRRISSCAEAIVAAEPDCVITIDTPDFSLRVAEKIKARRPVLPIIHYVCPSVWAWRPGRAVKMRRQVDEVLCILPFEPQELQRLGGPPGTYVGHRLSREPGLAAATSAQLSRSAGRDDPHRSLLVLPGSRRSEVSRLIGPFGDTVRRLAERGNSFGVTIPTLPRLEPTIRAGTADWAVQPRIVVGDEAKWQAYAQADAALAASGTVLLELALARIPMISCYRTDWLMTAASRLVTVWSAALPNLIADWPVVPELYNAFVRPEQLTRMIEQLWAPTPLREAQRAGLETVANCLATSLPAGELAAEAVLRHLQRTAQLRA